MAVEVGGDDEPATGSPAAVPTEEAVRRDARTRQLMAIQRAGREGTQLVHDLESRRSEFERHYRETVKRLEAAGYLHH